MAADRRTGWQQSTVSSNQLSAPASSLLLRSPFAGISLASCWLPSRLSLAFRSPLAPRSPLKPANVENLSRAKPPNQSNDR
jgi:hypothetical protein